MNVKTQELVTLVSDVKFTLTKLDPAKHQPLIDLLIEYTNKLEADPENYETLFSPFISKIERCISDNNMIVPTEAAELVKSFSAFLPH
ncbi:MAG: hypothetical protein Q4F66_04920 [Clostridium sp.]|nr:hypothetical protein [Clostridium sp.]